MAVGEQNQKSVRRISTISDMRAVSRELSPFGKRKTRLPIESAVFWCYA